MKKARGFKVRTVEVLQDNRGARFSQIKGMERVAVILPLASAVEEYGKDNIVKALREEADKLEAL